MSPKADVKRETSQGEEEVTVDMTTAKTLEPLDPKMPYLMAVSKWKYGKSANGNRKVDYAYTVAKPETKGILGRVVAGSSSLDNEYTLGFVKNLLIGLGFDKEKIEDKKFKMPHEDDVMGLTSVVFLRTRPAQGIYGERSEISRVALASAYPAEED